MGWNYLSIPKLQRYNRWSLGMDKLFHPILYNGCDYISMLGLKLNHVSKRGPWWLLLAPCHLELIEAEWRIYAAANIPPLLQIMACRLFGAKPLSEPMLSYCQLDPKEYISVKFYLKFKTFHSRKRHLRMSSAKWQPFCLNLNVLTLMPQQLVQYCVPIDCKNTHPTFKSVAQTSTKWQGTDVR